MHDQRDTNRRFLEIADQIGPIRVARVPWRAVRKALLIAVAIPLAFCVSALFAYGAAMFLVNNF